MKSLPTKDNVRILLVDDERAVTDNLAPFLERSGFSVTVAVDGEEALQQVEAMKPELLVLDVLMPRLDGREVLRRLRRMDNWTPIILLTQVGEASERAMALEEGSVVVPPATEVVLDPTEGWETYINQDYGYQFRHPTTATITESGVVSFSSDELPEEMSAEEYIAQLQAQYGNALCVQVEYALGYIYISASPNEDFRYSTCGRTGVGAGEIENKVEIITVGGHTYEANGFEFVGKGETLPEHNETFVLTLEDGTRIEYGARPVSDATYEDYLMKGKGVLLQILATYETIE